MRPASLLPVPRTESGYLNDVQDFSQVFVSGRRLGLEGWGSRLAGGMIQVFVDFVDPMPPPDKLVCEGGLLRTVGFAVSPKRICLSEHVFEPPFPEPVADPTQLGGVLQPDYSSLVPTYRAKRVVFVTQHQFSSEKPFVLPDENSVELVTSITASVSGFIIKEERGLASGSSLYLHRVCYESTTPFLLGALFGLSTEEIQARLPIIYELPHTVFEVCDQYAESFCRLNRDLLEEEECFYDFRKLLRRDFHFVSNNPSPPFRSLLAGYWFRFTSKSVSTIAPLSFYDSGQDVIAYFLSSEEMEYCRVECDRINTELEEIDRICAAWKNESDEEQVFGANWNALDLSFAKNVLDPIPFRLAAPCRAVGIDGDSLLLTVYKGSEKANVHVRDYVPIQDFFKGNKTELSRRFDSMLDTIDCVKLSLTFKRMIRRDLAPDLIQKGAGAEKYYRDVLRVESLQKSIIAELQSLHRSICHRVSSNLNRHSAVGGVNPVLLPGEYHLPELEISQEKSPNIMNVPTVPSLHSTTHVIVGGTSGCPIFSTPLDSQFPVVVAVAQGEFCADMGGGQSRHQPSRNYVQTFEGVNFEALHAEWKNYLDWLDEHREEALGNELERLEFGRSFAERSFRFDGPLLEGLRRFEDLPLFEEAVQHPGLEAVVYSGVHHLLGLRERVEEEEEEEEEGERVRQSEEEEDVS